MLHHCKWVLLTIVLAQHVNRAIALADAALPLYTGDFKIVFPAGKQYSWLSVSVRKSARVVCQTKALNGSGWNETISTPTAVNLTCSGKERCFGGELSCTATADGTPTTTPSLYFHHNLPSDMKIQPLNCRPVGKTGMCNETYMPGEYRWCTSKVGCRAVTRFDLPTAVSGDHYRVAREVRTYGYLTCGCEDIALPPPKLFFSVDPPPSQCYVADAMQTMLGITSTDDPIWGLIVETINNFTCPKNLSSTAATACMNEMADLKADTQYPHCQFRRLLYEAQSLSEVPKHRALGTFAPPQCDSLSCNIRDQVCNDWPKDITCDVVAALAAVECEAACIGLTPLGALACAAACAATSKKFCEADFEAHCELFKDLCDANRFAPCLPCTQWESACYMCREVTIQRDTGEKYKQSQRIGCIGSSGSCNGPACGDVLGSKHYVFTCMSGFMSGSTCTTVQNACSGLSSPNLC